MDLGRGANPKGYMVEEIWQELAKAKYMEWEHESTKRSWELQTLKYELICKMYVRFSISFFIILISACVSGKPVRLLLKKNIYLIVLNWKAS